MIPTPLEASGEFATAQQQTDWLAAVAADTTRVTVYTVGTTVGGLPIQLAAVGHPAAPASLAADPGSLMVIGFQHGNEAAGREGAMSLIRELAYSTDPDVIAYLAAHRVYVIPTVNVDRAGNWVARENLNGVDTNRDFLALTQPETRAVEQTLRTLRPAIVHDMHENNAQTPNVEISGSGNPEVAAALSATALAIRDQAYTRLTGLGVTSGPYPVQFFPTLFSNSAGLRYIIPVVTETNRSDPDRLLRTKAHRETAMAIIDYHRVNATTITTQISAARAGAASATGTFQIADGTALDLPTHYRLTDAQKTTHAYVLTSFGISTTADGVDWLVPVAQDARPVIPYLFDPASEYRIAALERVFQLARPAVGVPTSYGPIRVGGVTATVTSVELYRNGAATPVWTAG